MYGWKNGKAALAAVVMCSAGGLGLGCGGGSAATANGGANAPAVVDLDGDALALLPGKPVALVHVDVKAMYASQAVGASLLTLAQKAMPAGDASGFQPSRDLDEVYAGVYLFEGVDAAAILHGRFDVDRINQSAHAQANAGAPADSGGHLVVESTYAGHTLYTVNNTGFCTLTAKTLLAGTETGIRRTLDKIRDGKTGRDIDPGILDGIGASTGAGSSSTASTTTYTSGAASSSSSALGSSQPVAIAANFHTSPVPNVVPIPWIRSLDAARLSANFQDPGLNVAGKLSYPDASHAQAGSDGLNMAATAANVAAFFGTAPRIDRLSVQTAGNDVAFSFAIDDGVLRGSLSRLVNLLNGG